MLINHVDRYISLQRALGFKFRYAAPKLLSFAHYATARGDTHVRAATAMHWATTGSSPGVRHIRLQIVRRFALFLRAEDALHELPEQMFRAPRVRPVPYIYKPDEVGHIIDAVRRLRPSYPLRRKVYVTLLGLIASTGLRVSEALDLQLDDVLPNRVLRIRKTKFGKSRFVPLHHTTAQALFRYLELRRRLAVTDEHVFLSAHHRRIPSGTVNFTFRRLLDLAHIAPERVRRPRIHDLRHTFATRALEKCGTSREMVARHFVALATYLGHSDIGNTFWYLEATPELMIDIAAKAEALVAKEGT